VRKQLTVEELGDLVELPLLAVLATHRRDGSVMLSPVWHEWRDGGFNVVTRSGDGTEGVEEATRRIATRYLGPEGAAAYIDSGGDDLRVRLEPGELRTWDFADDFEERLGQERGAGQ
jgi:hypothetical protein